MSSLFNYIYDYWNIPQTIPTNETKNIYYENDKVDDEYSVIDKKYLISIHELEKINLKPPSNIIPGPSRNMPPLDKFNLQSLNKAQLTTILNVKLKPTPPRKKVEYYEPKHPVLKELLSRFKSLEI